LDGVGRHDVGFSCFTTVQCLMDRVDRCKSSVAYVLFLVTKET